MDQGAVLVQRVVVDLLVVGGRRVPLAPPIGHQITRVAVQGLADHRGVVARVLEPDGQVVVLVQLQEALEPAVGWLVGAHAVVVHVLAGEEGGARGAAEREVDEAVFERSSAITADQRVDVVHHPHRLERLVVRHDHHHVGRLLVRGRLADGSRGCPGAGNGQRGGRAHRRDDQQRALAKADSLVPILENRCSFRPCRPFEEPPARRAQQWTADPTPPTASAAQVGVLKLTCCARWAGIGSSGRARPTSVARGHA